MKFNKTLNTIVRLWLLFGICGFLVVSGVLYDISPILCLIVAFVGFCVTTLCCYITVRYFVSHGEYEFVPLLRLRLCIRNAKWQKSVRKIKVTGDYGMCCGEEEAIACAKEYHFGALIKYADKFKV